MDVLTSTVFLLDGMDFGVGTAAHDLNQHVILGANTLLARNTQALSTATADV